MRVLFLLLTFMLALRSTSAQKRSAIVDLDMLFADPASYAQVNPGETSHHQAGLMVPSSDFGKLLTLADTLKRLQGLEKYYAHQGRSRCVNSRWLSTFQIMM